MTLIALLRAFSLLCLVSLFASGAAHAQTPATDGVCYGSTGVNDGGRLLTIDPDTGAGTLVGASGVNALPGLAINSAGEIYATDNLLDSNLYRIDASTGAATFVGNMAIEGPDGIAFDDNDVLYVTETYELGNLYTVDVTTAVPTLVGSLDGLPVDDNMTGLAFDPIDGTLYGSTGGSTKPDTIYTIDKSTGAVTLVGSTGLGGSTPDLFFDDAGNLFGSKGGGGGSNTLISIDPLTAAGTAIGPIGFASVSGLDCAYLPEPSLPAMLIAAASALFALSPRRRPARPR